jgi:hypothetical protein
MQQFARFEIEQMSEKKSIGLVQARPGTEEIATWAEESKKGQAI